MAVPAPELQIPVAPSETSNDAVPRRAAPNEVDEVTRPVDMPMVREHGLTGHLLMGTDLRLDARVGRGASATVYSATRARGGLPLAVKVLHSGSQSSVCERFNREVDILRQIDSPGVVKATGRGVLADDRPWYAMELVDGQSLAWFLDTSPCSDPARVVGWLRSACRGLAAIHAAGWVHCDIKPANLVVVSVRGQEDIKIVDLGIAERIHTVPDMLCGTPEYMAPEQAEFGQVDVRSDIYGLGCCAYELLSGRRLVEGRTSAAKMLVHVDGVRPRWPRVQRIPLELRRLVERCLARQPEARPANMHALEAELERVAATLVRMDVRKAEQVLRSPLRPVTELGLGWPTTTALHISRREAQVPVRPRDGKPGRSWSGLARSVLAAFTPGQWARRDDGRG